MTETPNDAPLHSVDSSAEVSTLLSNADPQPVPAALDESQQARINEASVRRAEIAAKSADDDRQLREGIANKTFKAAAIQVVIADLVFGVYGFWNGWDIPGVTMDAWLSATVVQVIAVALVIARSLFPSEARKPRGTS